MTYSFNLFIDTQRLTEESRHIAKRYAMGRALQPSFRSLPRDQGQLHAKLAFDLQVPDDLTGMHAEYGTSIYAAGRAGLELARTHLAGVGIDRAELDKLTTADVSIERAAATYIFKFQGKVPTATFMAAMHHHALLLGLSIKYDRLANTVSYGGVVTRATSDTTQVVLTVLRQPHTRLIRIDVAINFGYLQAHGWTSLDSWRSAYAENRYAAIFNQMVRGLFQLDSPALPYREPGRDVLDKLPPTTEGLLREYFEGRDPMWFGRHAVANSEAKRKRLVKDYRDRIISITGIDIVIPWQHFRWTAPAMLKAKLIYPGDFQPPKAHTLNRFSESNWPGLLAGLRSKYELALSHENV